MYKLVTLIWIVLTSIQYVAFAQAVILQSLFCHELAYENNSHIPQTEQRELEG